MHMIQGIRKELEEVVLSSTQDKFFAKVCLQATTNCIQKAPHRWHCHFLVVSFSFVTKTNFIFLLLIGIQNRYANFGDLGVAVKNLIDEYQKVAIEKEL